MQFVPVPKTKVLVAVSLAKGDKPVAEKEAEGAIREAATRDALPSAMSGATREHPYENSLGMRFVPVPGTKVLFCIWDTRLRDFKAFVDATGYDAIGHDEAGRMFSLGKDGGKQRGATWKNPGFKQTATHPVVGVNWTDAKAFCSWLTKKERSEGRIPGDRGYRLPTDEEWSVAVELPREKGSTPKEKSGKIKGVYPWGTQWPPPKGAGNYAGYEARDENWPSTFDTIQGYGDDFPRTSQVGSFTANQYGLYDMGGNVRQWCEDWYDGDREWRVLRGASWADESFTNLESAYRPIYTYPFRRFDFFGFRCVLGSPLQDTATE